MRPDTQAALLHIQDAALFIQNETRDMTYGEFLNDRRRQLIVERNFEIIGEAISRISRHDPDVVVRISEFQGIIGLRNVIVHGYDVIKYSRIWRAVHFSLPILLREVGSLLEEADRDQLESLEE